MQKNAAIKFSLLIIAGCAIQYITLMLTQYAVPAGDGFHSGLAQAMSYLFVSQWIGYAILFFLSRMWLGRGWGALSICLLTLVLFISSLLALTSYRNAQNMRGHEAEMEQMRQEEMMLNRQKTEVP